RSRLRSRWASATRFRATGQSPWPSTGATRPCWPTGSRSSRAPCASSPSHSSRPRPSPRSARSSWRPWQGPSMGLSDRIKSNGNGSTAAVEHPGQAALGEQIVEHRAVADPYAELKTQIHHACIAKLGPQLFAAQTNEDLSEPVLRAVTEQLALDRTRLTREGSRQITTEVNDDIPGYVPLARFLAP